MRKSRIDLTQNTVYKLENLTQIRKNTFKIEDLFVPEIIKKEIYNFILEAKTRKLAAENVNSSTIIPKRKGIIGLFCGSSGTGKTIAAQMIALQLKLDLYRIDLSSIVSKYIGETERNLTRLFDEAGYRNWILFFDEADALFGKRSEVKDAHDSYANIETNFILHAIENFPGIVILSINRKANIDSGFTRRLRFVIEFPE
jgi:SpoVK/Ycf46/Vps4 family AAA+-type ATPase